jgi:hypothetical protein
MTQHLLAHHRQVAIASHPHEQQRIQSDSKGQVLDFHSLLPRAELQQLLAPQA